jgi:hypothetical protein
MSWYSQFIRINNTTLPSPRSYRVERSDLDSERTTRDESGYLHRDRIRKGVYKLYLQWRLTPAQLETIIPLIERESFSVTFLDPTSCAQHTATMYTGNRSAEIVLGAKTISDMLFDFTVDFIEL